MASNANADSRRGLIVDPPPPPRPPPPILKDVQGSDNPLPLSPQWVLSKPGDVKAGIQSHFSPNHVNRPDAMKASGIGDLLPVAEKKRDVFRPSWRDEERESNSSIRRDRWREGDKELGDTRKIDRWANNSLTHSADGRRVPSERWTDSSNKESHYDQRRESKWNTRWGPDDKESENLREKKSDSARDSEVSCDKVNSDTAERDTIDHEREGGHYSHSQRSNSSLTYGRGEAPHYQATPSKHPPMFSDGRRRGENGSATFSAGRGRVSSNTSIVDTGASQSYPLGTVSEKSEGSGGDPRTLRYSRMKLLDIYRMTDIKSHMISLREFIKVPSMTLEEFLEPLSLSSPSSEDLAILKGIDKGEIVSSGTSQASRDGSVVKTYVDTVPSKQAKLGSREDSPFIVDAYKDVNIDKIKGDHFVHPETPLNQKRFCRHGLDPNTHLYQENAEAFGTIKKADEFPTRSASILESPSISSQVPSRSHSVGEHSHGSFRDWKKFSAEDRSRAPDMGWSHVENGLETERKNRAVISAPYSRDESHWQNNKDFSQGFRGESTMKRQSSEILDQEKEGNVLHGQRNHFISNNKSAASKFGAYPSPEQLSLYYKDPHDQIQGPFSGSHLIGWFEAGYFGIDLQVRLESSPADTPFSSLGDVMPHLRTKAGPPPGFGAAKPNDVGEVLSKAKVAPGNIHVGTSDMDVLKNGLWNMSAATTEAENRLLMTGTQGYGGNSSGNMPSVGGESGSDLKFLLSQKMLLEHQRYQPSSHPYWPGRETSSISSSKDSIPDSLIQHSKLLSSSGDTRQYPESPQQRDLLSILQAAAQKSPSLSVDAAVPGRSNFPEVGPLGTNARGGLSIVQDNIDLHQNQYFGPQTGVGVEQQRLQPQSQSSLSHVMTQQGDLSSSVVLPGKYPSSEILQDPQMLSLLQQQYLLSQLQLHPQAVSSQLSLLDKILLLNQQHQKQEQQQVLLQQQQLLLSQVLSRHQSYQHFGDASCTILNAGVPAGINSMDHLGLCQTHEALQINQQMPFPNSHDGHASNLRDSNLQCPQDVNCTVSTQPLAFHMPHQMFDCASSGKKWDVNVSPVVKNCLISDPIAPLQASSFLSYTMGKSLQEAFVPQKNTQEMGKNDTHEKLSPSGEISRHLTSVVLEAVNSLKTSEVGSGTSDFASSLVEEVHDLKISSNDISVQGKVELPYPKEAKSVEAREVRKVSEKKSKKQKNLKTVRATDFGKGSSKTVTCKSLTLDTELEGAKICLTSSKVHADAAESIYASSPPSVGAEQYVKSADTTLDTQQTQCLLSMNVLAREVGTVVGKSEQEEVGTSLNSQAISSHRAWKPAPGLKAKSLIEIQQEEQRKAESETKVSETAALASPLSIQPTPWSGVSVDCRSSEDAAQGNLMSSRSRKSQLHDLLAEEVLAKSNDGSMDAPATNNKGSSLSAVQQTGSQVDISSFVDDDFVEAKDAKKNRKKATKVKGAGLKASSPAASADLCIPPVPLDKGKITSETQVEKESLPVQPTGPSLGDFVLWKGDQANSTPTPVTWFTDAGKFRKPASLREIQREQENKASLVHKQIPILSLAKAQPSQGNRGSSSSWLVSGSSPLKAASPVQSRMLTSAQSKSRTEDDLFWGPPDQTKQETKQLDFPSLVNSSSWGVKVNPAKGAPVGASSHQKPLNTRVGDYALSSSPLPGNSDFKGRKDASSKHSEAMDFRDWCENQLVRITGTKDTGFLEYCLNQPTSEAEILLRENLGSLDRNHEFIDKFLNYKDFLSPDVIKIAFQAQSSHKVNADGLGYSCSNNAVQTKDLDRDVESGLDATSRGKKKGKKGKKVMPSTVLGFNIVSNRIMMGEIQTADD